ncbi:unnamed protein product [Phaedon cochleariae]|uniref:non-specific serine/threonine protein kinase n=1 Tax=Phaedon cochleariae TaxID=80249 RepID=A0A9P0DMM6_PHACE|nr:unnamed protein product [Phaedon cochleariae]
MEGMEILKQGAEARIYTGTYLGKPSIAKERFVKTYRHPILDNFLTKERIKAECRAIVRCKAAGIRTPALYLVDFHKRTIWMEHFEHSITAKEFIENLSSSSALEELKQFALEVGKTLGCLHASNIVHGDLTTSNILLVNKNSTKSFKSLREVDLVMIDFGLSHTESSTEDKGVDLYVLERALLSTHRVAETLFPQILVGYQQTYKKGSKEVLSRFEEVRARGRKRTMVG